MIKILETEDDLLVKIAQKRWDSSQTIASEIENSYKKYLKVWKNLPDWIANVPEKRSKVRDNRAFLAMEASINKLTARPTKPNVIPANETDEAKQVATDLGDYFLEKYDDLAVKKTLKRGLRYLYICKLVVIKVFWDQELDNFNNKVVDPKKVRFSSNATCAKESEFAIEEIEEPILDTLSKFTSEEQQKTILDSKTMESAIENNEKITYREMWIGDGVCWIYKNKILDKIQHPYFDFSGMKVLPKEMKSLNKLNGKRRRSRMTNLKTSQIGRGLEGDTNEYEKYSHNYFDRPFPPFIFGTVLEIEDKPTGETSLMEQINPLQEGIDKRKRQIDDNADYVNGITKVDTDQTSITLADARRIHYDPGGLVFGPGVAGGVTREYGQSLPAMVFNDMEHSIRELDNLFGTMETFRGEGGKTETATGRAILREESYTRLNEPIDLIDSLCRELYKWWFQMMKVRYTETQMWKCIGAERAGRILEFIQDDFQKGIDIKIIPGQVLPEDKIFRAERASEDFRAGVLDPVTYFETAGGYDNPQEIAKRFVMFRQNPFSIIDMTPEDIQKIVQANQLLQQLTPQPAPGAPGGQNPEDIKKAEEMKAMRGRIQEMAGSEEFQKLSPEKKKLAIQKLRVSIKPQ